MGNSRTNRIALSIFAMGILFSVFLLSARAALSETVTFALPWIPYGNQVYVYVAKERGYFAKTGADIEIIRGFGSGDTAKKVAVGNVQFGIADFGSVVLAISQGAPIKVTLFLQPKSFLAVAYVEGRGISQPKDLEGKSGGTSPFNTAWQFMPAFAALTGFDIHKVKFISMAPEVAIPAFLKGDIQWLPLFLTEYPSLVQAGKKQGLTVKGFTYADSGLKLASNGVIFSDAVISSKPQFVGAGTQAIKEAFVWSIENPEGAVKIFLKYNPVANPAKTASEWRVGRAHAVTPEVDEWGVGYLPASLIQDQIELIRKYLKIGKSISSKDVMNMNFVGPKSTPRTKP